MTFKLACGDVMPGCAARFESTDRGTLMEQIGAHAASAHGITTFTPDTRRHVEAAIAIVA